MENRNGLAVDANVTKATGSCEREAALDMIQEIPGDNRATVGADKAYDARDFVNQCPEVSKPGTSYCMLKPFVSKDLKIIFAHLSRESLPL